MAGIYLHIPFCKQACYYCDFHFSTNQDMKANMVSAILEELKLRQLYLQGQMVETIYFGGGTPSLLTAQQLQEMLDTMKALFTVTPHAEITLEANPDDLSVTYLTALRAIGVNRLSIGIQSFDNDELAFLNRAHDGDRAAQCVHEARQCGFTNISIDLIYGVPVDAGQQWTSSLEQALALEPEHISAYSLTIEEKTVFGRWAAKGKLRPVDEALAALHFETLQQRLAEEGYEHYEISNFAKPGYYSKHNSSYWKRVHYLGVGPSAHSFNGVSRQYNVPNNHEYIRTITNGEIPCEIEWLTPEDHINDYLLTGLRTSWGVDLTTLRDEFNYDLMQQQDRYIHTLIQQGFAIIKDQHLILEKKGRMIADKISSDLFILKG